MLVIDMERDFVDEGAVMQTPGGLAIVLAINRLTAWARRHGCLVVFTYEMHRVGWERLRDRTGVRPGALRRGHDGV